MLEKYLIDSKETIVAIIAFYLFSLVVWACSYLQQVALMIFLIIDGPPRTKVEMAFINWWWIYPIVVVFCILFGMVTYGLRLKKATTSIFLFPLLAAILLAIPVLSTARQVWLEEQQRLNALVKISDLDLNDYGFNDAISDPIFEPVFIMPENTAEENIIEWDGRVLVYQTPMHPDDIHLLYADAYDIIGIESASSGGGAGYGSIDYRMGGNGAFIVFYSTSETQFFTTAGIITCAELRECWDLEDTIYSKYINN